MLISNFLIYQIRDGTVAWLFTEYDVARGILKFQYKTWEFRGTSYSINSQAIILVLRYITCYKTLGNWFGLPNEVAWKTPLAECSMCRDLNSSVDIIDASPIFSHQWHTRPYRIYEPRHDKTNKISVRPVMTQISLGIRPVWLESSLCAHWVAKDPRFLHADSENWSDWADAQADLSLRWAHIHFVGFVMSRLISSLWVPMLGKLF